MMNAASFRTRTLADLYVRQGHYDKAVDIYRHLLEEKPDDDSLRRAFESVEAKRNRAGTGKYRQSIDLFCQWIDLLNQSDRLRRLARFKRDPS